MLSEFNAVSPLPLATLGWEDGLHISPDGLHLYCTYVPIDFLSFLLNGDLPNAFSNDYLRSAPDFGMDLSTNPIGASEWLHSDILYAHRNSVNEDFTSWTLSNMARAFYSEGAPTPTFSSTTEIEYMLFTSNDSENSNTDIWFIQNTTVNPSGIGTALPAPIKTLYNEDNPHLVRLDENKLVLFFDSDNLPGGEGDHDIWFSESADNGITWSTPLNVSTINTSDKEHQPFLYKDKTTNKWYLYYAAVHTDGKLAIFRAEQDLANQWNSWKTPTLVLSAGNSAGIGEPTLTENGDLFFVVIYEDPMQNSIYNHFDSDPWVLKKKNPLTTINNFNKTEMYAVFPNPAEDQLTINFKSLGRRTLKIYTINGQLVFDGIKNSRTLFCNIDITEYNSGAYILTIETSNEFSVIPFMKK